MPARQGGAYPYALWVPTWPNAALDGRVLGVLRAGGLLTAEQIGAELRLDRLPVRRALIRLRDRGLVRLAGMDLDANAQSGGGPPGIWESVPACDWPRRHEAAPGTSDDPGGG